MEGDVLAQVETDKATMDMDSPQTGFMAKIVVPAGTKDIPLGKVFGMNSRVSLVLILPSFYIVACKKTMM